MISQQDFQRLAQGVCQVARQAGDYIRNERANFSVARVERKHAHDYVSYVDKASEQMIVEALCQLLPEAGFITEEGTIALESSDARSDSAANYIWVVDPLDGTTNFIHGFPPFAVSIALLCGRQIVVGVVYEIMADECFYAWQGGGAYLNGRPIHVGQSPIGDALLCLQLPYNSDAYKPTIKHLLDHFYGRVGSIRMLGSAAIALCYVAAGRLDAYAERYIGQWDFMAGALIVMEAGGCVTNYAGNDDFIDGDSVVATNGIVHPDLLEALKQSFR